MKITKVQIQHYRSCEFTEFLPHPELSVLIGPNGSGKTNVMSAIQLLTSLYYIRRSRFRRFEEGPMSESKIKTWFDWEGKNVSHEAKLALATNENNEDEILSTQESWYAFDITGRRKQIKLPLDMIFGPFARRDMKDTLISTEGAEGRHQELGKAFSEIGRFLSDIRYYSAAEFTNPGSCPASIEVEGSEGGRRRSLTGPRREHARLIYNMYRSYKSGNRQYKEFLQIIGPQGIGLIEELSFTEFETSANNYKVMIGGKVEERRRINLLVVPNFCIAGDILSPSQLSEGTFKTIALLFYLVTEETGLLLIEEPEVCVHHGLLASIAELIKVYSKEKQIIISTHSDTVLDQMDVENVFSVKRSADGGTKVANVTDDIPGQEVEALKDYLRHHGSLGEYWKYGDLE